MMAQVDWTKMNAAMRAGLLERCDICGAGTDEQKAERCKGACDA